jgi:hypothetical protein
MSDGKRIMLKEVFKIREAEIRNEIAVSDAYDATPQGAAEKSARDAYNKRMNEAEVKYARENQPDVYELGKAAALCGEEREAPSEMEDEAQDLWLEGWDSEGADDEEP